MTKEDKEIFDVFNDFLVDIKNDLNECALPPEVFSVVFKIICKRENEADEKITKILKDAGYVRAFVNVKTTL